MSPCWWPKVGDRLEVVDVEHAEADGVVAAANLIDLSPEQLLKAPAVGQAGELIGDSLASDLEMQIDVLERQCCLSGERPQHLALVVAV
jgi:hypothetical protein